MRSSNPDTIKSFLDDLSTNGKTVDELIKQIEGIQPGGTELVDAIRKNISDSVLRPGTKFDELLTQLNMNINDDNVFENIGKKNNEICDGAQQIANDITERASKIGNMQNLLKDLALPGKTASDISNALNTAAENNKTQFINDLTKLGDSVGGIKNWSTLSDRFKTILKDSGGLDIDGVAEKVKNASTDEEAQSVLEEASTQADQAASTIDTIAEDVGSVGFGESISGFFKFLKTVGNIVITVIEGLLIVGIVMGILALVNNIKGKIHEQSGCWLASLTTSAAYKVEFLTCDHDWIKVGSYPTLLGKTYDSPAFFASFMGNINHKNPCPSLGSTIDNMFTSNQTNNCGILSTCSSSNASSNLSCGITGNYDYVIKAQGNLSHGNDIIFNTNNINCPTETYTNTSWLGKIGESYAQMFGNWDKKSQPTCDSCTFDDGHDFINPPIKSQGSNDTYIGPCISRDKGNGTGYPCNTFYYNINADGNTWTMTQSTPWCGKINHDDITKTVCTKGGPNGEPPLWVPSGYQLVYNEASVGSLIGNLLTSPFKWVYNELGNIGKSVGGGLGSIGKIILYGICGIIGLYLIFKLIIYLLEGFGSKVEKRLEGSDDTKIELVDMGNKNTKLDKVSQYALDYKLLSKYD